MYEGYGTLRDKEGNVWAGEWKAGYPFNGNGPYKDWIGTYKGAWKNGMEASMKESGKTIRSATSSAPHIQTND